jgi:hypothetical protein
MTSIDSQPFTETHHALLFACLARSIMEAAGLVKGEAVVRQAVREYGMERGRRMALRAKVNGDALTMLNYIAYGEWSASRGAMKQAIVARAQHAKAHVSLCPWHTAWNQKDLLPYGQLYCLEIDKALVIGFNPDLHLEVNGTLTNGAEVCEFVYRGADLSGLNWLLLGFKKAVRPGKRARMPWEYHTGHLFTTVERVAVAALGDSGRRAVEAGLAEFGKLQDEAAAQTVAAYRGTDFSQVP